MKIPESVQAIDRQTVSLYRFREERALLLAACKAVKALAETEGLGADENATEEVYEQVCNAITLVEVGRVGLEHPKCGLCQRLCGQTHLSVEVINAYHRGELGMENLPKAAQEIILDWAEECTP